MSRIEHLVLKVALQVGATLGLLANATAAPPDPQGEPGQTGLAETTWLCVYPQARPFELCFKGTSESEGALARCEERAAKLAPRRPRFRVGDGPWIAFPDKHWRCVALPAGRPLFALENHGRPFASWRIQAPPDCASHVVDLTRQNSYGAVNTKCSRRDLTQDERLPPDAIAPR